MSEIDPALLQVGDTLPELVDEPLTRTDFVRYQGASGDMNPIHHDEGYARSAGFPTVFAVGMLGAGILGTYVAELFGPENVRKFKVQFREQAWPDDVLTYTGTVVARRENELDLELAATRQTGGVHLRGWATVICRIGAQVVLPMAH
jgi:acyl dehydratase